MTSGAWDQPLRPFFGYHGGKWRDTPRHYPAPLHDTVVEPFAGSAGYSVRFRWKKVVLCECDPIVAGVWRFLKRAKPEDILSLPDLEPEESVDDLQIEEEAKWLIGFWLNRGVASPRKRPSRWMRRENPSGIILGQPRKEYYCLAAPLPRAMGDPRVQLSGMSCKRRSDVVH